MLLTQADFSILSKCPWCEENIGDSKFLYEDSMGCEIVKCEECGVVFAKKRLNEKGLAKYWADYLSRVHIHDKELVNKRNIMYKIDYNYISNFVKGGNVLDVGCGNGDFLSYFKNGYKCFGVEYGKEAACEANKKFEVYQGELINLQIKKTFDLVIFRGVLQYLPRVKEYIDKAISVLNKNGCIYITAQPNMESFCFKLFKDKFALPVTGADFIGFNEKILTNYFEKKNMVKVGERYFYEETPYADQENDILKVAKAIECKHNGNSIDFSSPAFYGNMMSLVYKKIN